MTEFWCFECILPKLKIVWTFDFYPRTTKRLGSVYTFLTKVEFLRKAFKCCGLAEQFHKLERFYAAFCVWRGKKIEKSESFFHEQKNEVLSDALS